jgi:hypothetical protein
MISRGGACSNQEGERLACSNVRVASRIQALREQRLSRCELPRV